MVRKSCGGEAIGQGERWGLKRKTQTLNRFMKNMSAAVDSNKCG